MRKLQDVVEPSTFGRSLVFQEQHPQTLLYQEHQPRCHGRPCQGIQIEVAQIHISHHEVLAF